MDTCFSSVLHLSYASAQPIHRWGDTDKKYNRLMKFLVSHHCIRVQRLPLRAASRSRANILWTGPGVNPLRDHGSKWLWLASASAAHGVAAAPSSNYLGSKWKDAFHASFLYSFCLYAFCCQASEISPSEGHLQVQHRPWRQTKCSSRCTGSTLNS